MKITYTFKTSSAVHDALRTSSKSVQRLRTATSSVLFLGCITDEAPAMAPHGDNRLQFQLLLNDCHCPSRPCASYVKNIHA
jgi:hypothetical protein